MFLLGSGALDLQTEGYGMECEVSQRVATFIRTLDYGGEKRQNQDKGVGKWGAVQARKIVMYLLW